MGRLDIAMKQLMNDRDVFADAFNFRRADGHKLDPSNLREMDPSVYAVDGLSGLSLLQSSDLAQKLVVRSDESRTCALLLLENQSHTDRLMPFRFLYAAAMHWRRVTAEIVKRHRKTNDLEGSDDFLSGFGPGDRLPHAYMMVLYAGKEPWRDPRRLAELLDEADSGCGLYEPDCRLNLISLTELSDAEDPRFKTNEMKVMATAVRLQDDLDRLREVALTDPAFRNVNRDLFNVVQLSTGYKLPQPEKERGNDMGKAIVEYEKKLQEKATEKRNNEIVTNMLHEKMAISVIEKVTNVPLAQIIQIAKANNIPLQ